MRKILIISVSLFAVMMMVLLTFAYFDQAELTTSTMKPKSSIKKIDGSQMIDYTIGDKIIQKIEQKHGDVLYEVKEDDAYSFDATSSYREQEIVAFNVDEKDKLHIKKTSSKEEFTSILEDTQLQQELWHRFTDLIPAENREMVNKFIIMTDGQDNMLAYVQQMYDENQWNLALDYQDAQNLNGLYATLIHEYGHLFSLNSYEYIDGKNCTTDEILDFCYRANSYLYEFYDTFWKGNVIKDWPGTSADENEALDFYDIYSEEFVTAYAATDVTEDFAESWMYFILSEKPESYQISDDKILFFYAYPELVLLRNEILNNLFEHYP